MDSNVLAGTGSRLTNIVKRHQRIKFMVPKLDGKRSGILREVSFEGKPPVTPVLHKSDF